MLDPPQLSSSPLPTYFRRSSYITTTTGDTAITSAGDDFEFVVQEQQEEEQHIQDKNISTLFNDSIMIQPRQQPTILRILFMGDSLSDKHKNNVLKKFSEALASMVQRQPQFQPSSLSPTSINNGNNDLSMDEEIVMTLNERKHHVIFLDTFDSEPIDTYEDHGISVIEADFTWSATTTSLSSDEEIMTSSTHLLLQQQHHLLQAYIDHHWKKLDLVVYFFSSHSMTNTSMNRVDQEMNYIKQLSNEYHIPTWPILVHRPYERSTTTSSSLASSRPSTSNTFRTASPGTPAPHSTSTTTTPIRRFRSPIHNPIPPMTLSEEVDPISLKQSFLEQLIRHEIQCVDLSGINPEQPNFMGINKNKNKKKAMTQQQQQLDIMTVDQFITIDKKELACMLKRWSKSTQRARLVSATAPSSIREQIIRKLRMIGSQMILIIGVLLLLMSGVIYNNQKEGLVNEKKEQVFVEKVQLHPTWSIINQETLRHLFLIQLPPSLQNDQDLDFSVLLFDHTNALREYPMEYNQHQGSYSVDIPSPCLLYDDHNYIASVFWYHPKEQQKVEKNDSDAKKSKSNDDDDDMILIDRVELTVEACDRMMAIQSTVGANKMCKVEDGMTLSTTIITYPQNVDDALNMLMTSIKALWIFLLHGLYKNIIE